MLDIRTAMRRSVEMNHSQLAVISGDRCHSVVAEFPDKEMSQQ